MTNRELFRAALKRELPERIPFVARLDLWHNAAVADNALPKEIEGLSISQIEKKLRMGRSARFSGFFQTHFQEAEYAENRSGNRITTQWRLGDRALRQVYAVADEEDKGMRGHMVEHPLKSAEDYELMADMWERAEWRFDHEAFRQFDKEIGDDGLPLIIAGACPAHLIMLNYAGYDNFYLHCADFPDRVEALADAMEKSYDNLHHALAESPAGMVLHGAHWSSAMTPPPVFRRFMLPYFQRFTALMHEAGKQCVFHADADLSNLLAEVTEAGMDVADCFACAPLVELELPQARRVWGDDVVIWGGIPSTILLPSCPRREFQDYLDAFIEEISNGRAIIVGVSDNLMPGSEWDRIVEAADRIAEIKPTY